MDIKNIVEARNAFKKHSELLNKSNNINNFRKQKRPVFQYDQYSKNYHTYPIFAALKDHLQIVTFAEFDVIFQNIFSDLSEDVLKIFTDLMVLSKLKLDDEHMARIAEARAAYDQSVENHKKEVERFEKNQEFLKNYDSEYAKLEMEGFFDNGFALWNKVIDDLSQYSDKRISETPSEAHNIFLAIFAYFAENMVSSPNSSPNTTNRTAPMVSGRQYINLDAIKEYTIKFEWENLKTISSSHIQSIFREIEKLDAGIFPSETDETNG